MIKFNQNVWLKPYIWHEHRSKKKKRFWKRFFKLMNIAVFQKTEKCEKTCGITARY